MIDTPEKQAEAPRPNEDRTARKAWWIVGGITCGVVLLLAATAAGVWIWTVSSPEESETHNEEFDRTVAGVDVAVEIGDIELNASDGAALVLERETRWRGNEPEPEESWQGDTFTAVGNCDDDLVFWWDGEECEVDYTLALPSGAAAEATNAVGEVRMNGLDGPIDIETSVGVIEGDDLRATETNVESSVGSIRLDYAEVRGDINVIASTGDVEIIVPDDGTTYAVQFDSGVGGRTIDIATDSETRADYVITVNTSVGDLSVRYAD